MPNKGFYTKEAFRFDLRRGFVTCPAGATAGIRKNGDAIFSPLKCGPCGLRSSCTSSTHRSLQVHRNEELLIQLRKRKTTRRGRAELRKRVVVEHSLALISAIQGRRARYVGARKNLLDLNRAATLANLFALARTRLAA